VELSGNVQVGHVKRGRWHPTTASSPRYAQTYTNDDGHSAETTRNVNWHQRLQMPRMIYLLGWAFMRCLLISWAEMQAGFGRGRGRQHFPPASSGSCRRGAGGRAQDVDAGYAAQFFM
jgi:hypothetical protein